jgi:hypothetical protein
MRILRGTLVGFVGLGMLGRLSPGPQTRKPRVNEAR